MDPCKSCGCGEAENLFFVDELLICGACATEQIEGICKGCGWKECQCDFDWNEQYRRDGRDGHAVV